ncbi:MAG: hypothetical protein IJ083_17530 [Clostridia bacterium]|nr:hypothetical protein [Clostridia bacterium]
MAKSKTFQMTQAAISNILGTTEEEQEVKAQPSTDDTGKAENPKKERKTRVNLTLDSDAWRKLQKIAYVNRQSYSEVISTLISDYVASQQDALKEYARLRPEG